MQVASGFFVVQLKAGAYILRNERNISQIPLFLHSAVRDKKKVREKDPFTMRRPPQKETSRFMGGLASAGSKIIY